MSIDEPPWQTERLFSIIVTALILSKQIVLYFSDRDFIKWQNKIFKAELDRAAAEFSPDDLERVIPHPAVLKIRGTKIQVRKLSLQALQST